MQYISLLILPALAAALPAGTPLVSRAGGAGAPIAKPIPENCKMTYLNSATRSTSFDVTPEFQADNMVYQYSLNPGATQPDGTDDAQATQQCLETCYGFGNPGDCTAVVTGHQVSIDQYGSTSNAEFVCKMFKNNIDEDNLVAPQPGESASNAHAIRINCS